jgi:hypothetical protein
MKTKNINMKEAQTTAKIDLGKNPPNHVANAQSTVSAIKANPDYATKPEVQQVTTSLGAAADALDKNLKAITALRVQEKTLLTSQIVLLAALKRAAKSATAVITETAGGSAEEIKKWGLDVAGRAPLPPSTAAPDGLRVTYTKELAMVMRWKGVRGSKGYELQIGDGTPQGWGQPIHATRAHFLPTGLTPGQKIAIRVAVHRSTGLSAYSDPVNVTVH